MATSFDAARRVLERHGGTVERYIGDAVMAVFGLPVRHEDDALRAIRSAHDMQHELATVAATLAAERGVQLHVAIGVNTGDVVAGDASLGQRLVTGDAVNVAARLEQAAPAGGVIIGDLTYRLARHAIDVESVPALTLKGKAEPVPAYQLTGLRTVPTHLREAERPLVGREAELDELRAGYDEAILGGSCRMATLFGDAGVGKTRLTEEFLRAVGSEALVARGRCLPYGDGITFWPIVELVRTTAAIDEDDPPDVARTKIGSLVGDEDVLDRLASAIGLGGDQTFQLAELFWGIRRFLEILAADRPVVVLFDDIHWAEPTFLDLVEQLTATSDAPVMILCGARPELLERLAGLGDRCRPAADRPGPAVRFRCRARRGSAPRRRRPRRRRPAADHPVGRGQPAVHRAGALDAHREWSAAPGRRSLGGGRRPVTDHDPADDPGSARCADRPARRSRPGGPRSGLDHRSRVRDPGTRIARGRCAPQRPRDPSRLAERQGARPTGSRTTPMRTASVTSSSGTRPTPACSSGPGPNSTSGSSRGRMRRTGGRTAPSSSRRSSATTSSRPTATDRSWGHSTTMGSSSGSEHPPDSLRRAAGRSVAATCRLRPTCCSGRSRCFRTTIPSGPGSSSTWAGSGSRPACMRSRPTPSRRPRPRRGPSAWMASRNGRG